MREQFLRALVIFGAILWLSTELLSVFHAVSWWPLVVCWSAAGVWALVRFPRLKWAGLDPVVSVCAAGCLVVLGLTGVAAAFSPPNSADAMAYHMPRVVYWAEQHSIRFFPTSYFPQIMLQPFAEYLMLHTYVITGGDRLINFVQWFASAASMVAASFAAGLFGSRARGQALAAFFCATVPSGILASSGAKNDYFLAMWLMVAVCFALLFENSGRGRDAVYMGAALGFALFTKGTAYLFAPWVLLSIVFRRRLVPGLALAILVAIAINTPQYLRNYGLSRSIMGFDSAQGDGFFRWRNERFGWRETASNAIRNVSDQLGARSEQWNRRVYGAALALHRAIGFDANDPATTWRWSYFGPPVNANHEANAPNRWQLALLPGIFLALAWRHDRQRAVYAMAVLLGFVTFCAYLKWQPFFSRLLLPLFVLAAPLAGILEEVRGRGISQIALCIALLANARSALLENWVRPLKGPKSVFLVSRDAQYFSDLTQWHNEPMFRDEVEMVIRSKCETVGIDINRLQIEYPIEALLRERSSRIRFVHTGVNNASSKYAPPVAEKPCVVVELQ